MAVSCSTTPSLLLSRSFFIFSVPHFFNSCFQHSTVKQCSYANHKGISSKFHNQTTVCPSAIILIQQLVSIHHRWTKCESQCYQR
uniref:Uncharacterized protein n=1 Tax=Rhizophora mucronata TaxID=61149 RepID=A0A2P2PHW4_RHIMU